MRQAIKRFIVTINNFYCHSQFFCHIIARWLDHWTEPVPQNAQNSVQKKNFLANFGNLSVY
ncbi:hypothetical protein PN36_05965 [Candidatus Thiomargarita nelsonii]|uniref:Uncharacterized protein n=1 Tax=Candidatus Thiomargarita nelsonii TaxID=1003181 RepID=A0A4E0QRY2_9GAMM|nr:hypothetical protein PN36_05965 [Candidatus Thiomargarita nelsonii]